MFKLFLDIFSDQRRHNEVVMIAGSYAATLPNQHT